ncbi:MAG: hypothetical protein ACE5GB_09925 [Acidimicrobiales bacterium]
MAGEFDEIRGRLEVIAEELADLAIERLRESIDAGGTELPVDERRRRPSTCSAMPTTPSEVTRRPRPLRARGTS